MVLGNITFSLLSFFYIILIVVVYFIKPRIHSRETQLYSLLIICCALMVCCALGTYFCLLNLDKVPVLSFLFSNGYLVFMMLFLLLMTLYIIYISFNEDKIIKKKIEKHKTSILWLSLFMFLGLFAAIMILPLNYHIDGTVVYTYGPAAELIFAITKVITTIWIVLLIARHKKVQWKKYVPMIVYIILGSVASVTQQHYPELLLSTSVLVFVTFLMYFTIENPDVKMIEQLEIAKEDADHANKAKTEFLSSMSHEIRTPLNAIIGFSECIRDAKTKDEAKENAGDIISAANTLLETVNGILDISKIEAGKLEITKTNYDPIGLFDECVKLVKPRMDDKGLEFISNYAKDIPKILNGDYSNLKKVILNILTNAAKYTDHGSVKFDVHCVNKTSSTTLIISVADTGRGIKQENIDKLFDKFERGEENNNTSIEGTGLGLAITKQLVHLMNGKITVQSAYGEGSTFTVTVPQRIVADKEAVIVNKKETKKIQIEDFSGKTILIVDDNKLNRKVAAKILEPFKVEVMTVSSGEECLEALEMIKVDLILMDDMMPHMSGVETLKRLKEKAGFKTPVVALTANAIAGMKEKYLKDGFNDYLAKPIERPELSRVLNKFFNK